jgi:hypothetical protein
MALSAFLHHSIHVEIQQVFTVPVCVRYTTLQDCLLTTVRVLFPLVTLSPGCGSVTAIDGTTFASQVEHCGERELPFTRV